MVKNDNLLLSSEKGYIVSSELKDLGVSYSEAIKWCSENDVPFLDAATLEAINNLENDREVVKKHTNSPLAKELVTFKPFSRAKEQMILKLISNGRVAQSFIDKGADSEELHQIVREGKKAEDRLILSLGHYYIKLATPFIGKGTLYEDILTAGIDGATKALSRFDFSKGFRFSTYATWWIIQAMQNEVATFKQGKTLPTSRYQVYKKVTACRYKFEKDFGRMPTDEELIQNFNLTQGQIKIAEEIYYSNPISFDTLVTVEKKEDQIPLSEMVESSDEPDMLQEHLKMDAIQKVLIAMEKCLSENEKFLIMHKYLCNVLDVQLMTDEEIGKALGVTTARIYQIDKASISKLKTNQPLKEAVADWYNITN